MEQVEAKERQTVTETRVGILPIKDVNEFFRIIEGIRDRDQDFLVSSLHTNKRETQSQSVFQRCHNCLLCWII
jgi:hypothetical protein